jgi:ubiquinone/menaquinone biosynthesis C-methylase UbiE
MDSDYLLDKQREVARQRLGVLERISDPGTIDYLERIGVAEGWHCLELGAGGGSIAAWLCRRVGSAGRVVATDVETHFLRELALDNLQVLEHDAAADPLDVADFDLVHARNVLIHIPQREEVLRKLARAVKPGGWLLLEEPDVITDSPDPSAPDDLARLYRKVMAAIYAYLEEMGLEPHLGARLLGQLRALGFESLGAQGRVHMFQGSSAGTKSPHMMAFPDVREAVVAAGGVSDAEFDEFLALPGNPDFAWREALTMAAWGRRP